MHAQQGYSDCSACQYVHQFVSLLWTQSLSELGTFAAFSCNVRVTKLIIFYIPHKHKELWKVSILTLCPNYLTKPHLSSTLPTIIYSRPNDVSTYSKQSTVCIESFCSLGRRLMFLKTAHGVGTTCDVKLAIKGVPLPVKGWNVSIWLVAS